MGHCLTLEGPTTAALLGLCKADIAQTHGWGSWWCWATLRLTRTEDQGADRGMRMRTCVLSYYSLQSPTRSKKPYRKSNGFCGKPKFELVSYSIKLGARYTISTYYSCA